MWRPNDWRNPFPRYRESDNLEKLTKIELEAEANGVMGEAYEAGADAMVKALKEAGQYVDASKCPYGFVYNHVTAYPRTFKGFMVLIPDV